MTHTQYLHSTQVLQKIFILITVKYSSYLLSFLLSDFFFITYQAVLLLLSNYTIWYPTPCIINPTNFTVFRYFDVQRCTNVPSPMCPRCWRKGSGGDTFTCGFTTLSLKKLRYVQYRTVQHTTLYYTILYYTILHYSTLHYTTPHYTTQQYRTLQCSTVRGWVSEVYD